MLFADLWRANQITNKRKSSQRDTARFTSHENRHAENQAQAFVVWACLWEAGRGEAASKTPFFLLIGLRDVVNYEL